MHFSSINLNCAPYVHDADQFNYFTVLLCIHDTYEANTLQYNENYDNKWRIENPYSISKKNDIERK